MDNDLQKEKTLGRELFEASPRLRNWTALKNVLLKKYPDVDLSVVNIVGYKYTKKDPSEITSIDLEYPLSAGENRESKLVKIRLSINALISPLNMELFGLCTRKGFSPGSIATMVGIVSSGINVRKEEFYNDRHLIILANFTKDFSSCALKYSFDKEQATVSVYFSGNKNVPGSKNKTRSIPKNWGLSNLASYILATGDLPTHSRAEKLTKLEYSKAESACFDRI